METPKINTQNYETNKKQTQEEIRLRLMSNENQKARKLLEQAMGHMQALQLQTQLITIQVTNERKPK